MLLYCKYLHIDYVLLCTLFENAVGLFVRASEARSFYQLRTLLSSFTQLLVFSNLELYYNLKRKKKNSEILLKLKVIEIHLLIGI